MASRQLDEEAIFHLARQIPSPAARSTYLDQICAGDQPLRERVVALLKVYETEQEFLKSSEPGATFDHTPVSEGPGTEIGRYKLLQNIGEGGFGVVYMAEQHRPVRRKVALKIIKPGMDTRAVVARFEAERQALALMDHPNISRVLDGGTTESGRPYFVMELVKGVPITEYCDANNLTTEERLKLFITVCHAVQHAHQKGIIHRDLKPSNILVTLHDGQPVVKVIDFGVAKAINQQLTERTLFTAYGQMVGTPQYMSPEQAEMSGLDVDTRSDVYSLGVVLYELLTGTTPLEGERLRTAGYAEMQRIIREEEPPKPSTRLSTSEERLTIIAKHRGVSPERLHRTIRGDLDWVVMKAMEKDRSRRYETAIAFAADVQNFLHDEVIVARRPTLAYRTRKFIRRNRALVAGSAAVICTLCFGFAATSLALTRAWMTQSRLRNVALERALADVLARDETRTLESIQLAEHVGVSDTWLVTLRAQSDANRGRYEQARRLMTPIVEGMRPGDGAGITALSLLANLEVICANENNYIKYRERLRDWKPQRPDDKLFLALAETDWQKRLEQLTTVLKERPSPIALASRGFALFERGIDTGDVQAIEQFARDTEYANLFLGSAPDSRAALVSSAIYHRTIYEMTCARDDSKAASHLASLKECIAKLRSLPASIETDYFDMDCCDRVNDIPGLLRAARASDYGSRTDIEFPAAFLFSHFDDPKSSLDRFKTLKFTRESPSAQIAEAHFLAETSEGRRELLPRFERLKQACEEWPHTRWRLLTILALMGDGQRLQTEAQELLRLGKDRFQYWGIEKGIRVLAEDFDEARSTETLGPGRRDQCTTHYAWGLKFVAKGDRGKAKEQFTESVKSGVWYACEYAWSKAFLSRMERDPKWPGWMEHQDVQH